MWSVASRARVGHAVFERYAAPVRQFPSRHHPLRVARIAAGFTQDELSLAAHVHKDQLARIERHVTPGSASCRLAIADALGLTVEELFTNA